MTDLHDPIEVRTACNCAGTPHPDGDVFYLAPELPFAAGVAAVSAISNLGDGDPAAALYGAILRNGGLVSWNLVDDAGKPLDLTPTSVKQRVTWLKGGVELAVAIHHQFVEGNDLTPFGLSNSASRNGSSSPTGRTATSTSPKTRSSPKLRALSASSSPTSSDGEPSPETE